MKFPAALAAALAASLALAAAPAMTLRVDRSKIYLGESFLATVSVDGLDAESPRPAFPAASPAKIEYLGSQGQNYTSIRSFNGTYEKEVFRGRLFRYQITPAAAGTFQTGEVALDAPGGRVACRGATVEVTGVEARADVEASISCPNQAILVDSSFRVTLSVSLRALPAPNDAVEPVWPRNPLHLQADFLSFPPVEGLDSPDAKAALAPLVADGRGAAFTINDYQRDAGLSLFSFGANPFSRVPVEFRLRCEPETRGGTNWWRYSASFDYTPRLEGDYTFGPVTAKGPIVVGPNADGSPKMEEVFVVGPAITVRVVPPPEEGRPECFSGGVGRSLAVKASLDASRCKVGDPLSLTLDMTGDISAAALRPPLPGLLGGARGDFRIYDSVESESIPGGKRFRYRLRPLRAGTLEFPAVETAYYDVARTGYVSVASAPIPVQVEATTQIATGAPAEDGDGGGPIPEGIVYAADDAPDAPVPGFPSLGPVGPRFGRRFVCLWLPPALWLLAAGGRALAAALRRHAERTRFGRVAAAALRRFRAAEKMATRRPAQAAEAAIHAARDFVAATLSSASRALTASEMRRLLAERGAPASFAERFCEAFGELEERPYRKAAEAAAGGGEASAPPRPLPGLLAEVRQGLRALPEAVSAGKAPPPAGDWRTLSAAVAILLLAVSSAPAGLFTTPPGPFEWERAQSAMASARAPGDFAAAASLYYEMATNGAATGPLYANLGTALLLAGKPRAAAEAFDVAARWRGMAPEVLQGRLAAEKALTGSAQLPAERYLLAWHYGLPVQVRAALAIVFWDAFWLCLAAAALSPRASDAARGLPRALGAAFRLASALAGIGLLLFGGSVAATRIQTRSPQGIAALEQAAPVSEAAAGEGRP